MRTAVADTSIEAYHAMRPVELNASQQRLMDAIEDGQDYSRSELAAITGMRLSSVCGRVNELIAAQRLEHGPQRSCRETGKTVNPVRLPREQRELF